MSQRIPMRNNRFSNSCSPYLTDSLGRPIINDKNSLTIGPNGKTLLEDMHLIDKLAHFDRERIPERVVHAKGAGAFGVFVPYQSMCQYTCADFLNAPNKPTNVFVRFSTTGGSKGSADTVRDVRGFAVKFYTNHGIYDLVGNHIPVFFIRDAMKFPDLVHAAKPDPHSNLRDPERFWDFISCTPESTHIISWLYSDAGIIKNYAKMNGYSVNTYVWVNAKGERRYIKYHWKSMQGIETISRQKAAELAGTNPDIASSLLFNDIAQGNCPKYELCVQMMCEKDAQCLDYNPLDATKIWSECDFPLCKVGLMTLNKNPENFFAQVEQAAFCPGNLVNGIEFSADKLLQGRSFSYPDTQRYRLGANYAQLPVNRSLSPVCNNQRDGAMTYHCEIEPINYSPNSLNGNRPYPACLQTPPPVYAEGCIERAPICKENDFCQAGERYLSLSEIERTHLCENIALELCLCRNEIIDRALLNFRKACPEWARLVQKEIRRLRK